MIVVEVVVLWLMIGGDSRHKVVGGAQASLILGSNPVLGTCLHHSAPPNSTRGGQPKTIDFLQSLRTAGWTIPSLVQLSKEIDLETMPVRQPVGRWWDKAWRLGRPSPTWRKLALGEWGCRRVYEHITYSTLSNIFIIPAVFLFASTLNTAMVTV